MNKEIAHENKYFNELDLKFVNKVIKTSLDIMKTKISVNHLIDPLAKLIFSLAIKSVNERGMFCPEIDLQILVDDKDRLDRFRAFNYPYEVTTVSSLIQYLFKFTAETSLQSIESTIVERFTRQSMDKLVQKMYMELSDSTKSTKEMLRRFSFSLDSLSMQDTTDKKIMSSDDLIKSETDYMNSPLEDVFPTTGIPPIDAVNDGLNAPSLTIISGEEKSGKSSLLYNIAVSSLKQGRAVLFGTIEIPTDEAMRKLVCCYFGLNYNKINKKQYTEEEKKEYLELLQRFKEETKDKIFMFEKDDGMCTKDLEIQVSILEKAGIIIQDIIVDYTLIMRSNNPKFIGNEGLAYIPSELRSLSKKTNTRIFSAAQLHKRDKLIEDITTEDIYFMKNLAHEITYLLFLKTRKRQDGFGNEITESFLKFSPSRQLWDSRIYAFYDIDFDRLQLGNFEIVESTEINKENKRSGYEYSVHQVESENGDVWY